MGVPEVPFHIDALLTDSALVGGLLGDQHLPGGVGAGLPDLDMAGDSGRPQPPGLCVSLEYAVSLPGQSRGGKELSRLRRQWFAKRKNVVALLRETIFQQESPLVDTDASNKAADADAALQELAAIAFGYLTATVTVMDEDAAVADELRMVERVIQGRGFVTIPETLNAVDAWLSSIPATPTPAPSSRR